MRAGTDINTYLSRLSHHIVKLVLTHEEDGFSDLFIGSKLLKTLGWTVAEFNEYNKDASYI